MDPERIRREVRVWRGFFRQIVEEAASKARERMEELRTRYHLIRLREELREAYARLGQAFFESLDREEELDQEAMQKLIREIYEYRELIRDLESMLRR